MSEFFNPKRLKAMETGEYFCPKCGSLMLFEDEYEDTLICSKCHYDMDLDRYGYDSDEEYESTFLDIPVDEKSEDNKDGESYDEVCDELGD